MMIRSIAQGGEPTLLAILQQLVQSAIGRLAIDAFGRLKVYQDMYPSGLVAVTSGGNGPTAGAPVISSQQYYPCWVGPVDQRWEMIQRSNQEFSVAQRANFTF